MRNLVVGFLAAVFSVASFASAEWTEGPVGEEASRDILELISNQDTQQITAKALQSTLTTLEGMHLDTVSFTKLSLQGYYNFTVRLLPGRLGNEFEGVKITGEVLMRGDNLGAYVFNYNVSRIALLRPTPGVGMGNR